LTTIGEALKLVDPEGPNTINVSGSCNENVVIQSFGRLTLNAFDGASINDASGGARFVVDIEDSTDVTLQGFTISGGDVGVFCGDFSVCRFKNNTIQNATDVVSGDGYGVWVGRSRATLDGDILQYNAERGLNITNGSTVYAANIRGNNNNAGAFVLTASAFFGDPANTQNNLVGVRVVTHSTFGLLAGAITGNAQSGVSVESGSEAAIQSFDGPINISGNGGNGVQIHDLSFANFVNGGPTLKVTGNAPPRRGLLPTVLCDAWRLHGYERGQNQLHRAIGRRATADSLRFRRIKNRAGGADRVAFNFQAGRFEIESNQLDAVNIDTADGRRRIFTSSLHRICALGVAVELASRSKRSLWAVPGLMGSRPRRETPAVGCRPLYLAQSSKRVRYLRMSDGTRKS
jgi:hypothetical protein